MAGAAFPKANVGLFDDAASSSLPAVTGTEDLDPPAPNENPGVPEATAPLLPAGIGNDDVFPTVVPNENIVLLLDGSEAPFAAAALAAAGGGTPNENPGTDAPLSFFSPTSLAPIENPSVLLAVVVTGSSFFSSPDAEAPNLKPTNDEGLVAGAGAAAATPKLKPVDGTAGLLEVSSVALGLDGVLAGVAVGPLKVSPPPTKALPLLNDEAAGNDDAAAAPNRKPPAPMLVFLVSFPSSRTRFAFAGVAPALASINGLEPAVSPVDDDGGPPNVKPPAPMTPALAFLTDSLPASVMIPPLPTTPPALGVSHARHLPASFGFLTEHDSHFHSPGLDLNKLPHPDVVAGGSAAAASATKASPEDSEDDAAAEGAVSFTTGVAIFLLASNL
jgi:hypothetical protein